jgi:hypothetical protein
VIVITSATRLLVALLAKVRFFHSNAKWRHGSRRLAFFTIYSLPLPNRILPFFRRWILRDVRNPHPAGVIHREPPDGSVIAQGEESARGCADLDDPSHASTTASGLLPERLTNVGGHNAQLLNCLLKRIRVTPSSFVQYRSSYLREQLIRFAAPGNLASLSRRP